MGVWTTGGQSWPAIVRDVNESFLIAWSGNGVNGGVNGIRGQLIEPDGLFAGDEFQISSYNTGQPIRPVAARIDDGRVFVVWEKSDASAGDDTDSSSITARLFVLPLFRDGFESGDTTAWSVTIGE